MDEKTVTAIATSLALLQIQINALLALMEQQHSNAPLRNDFHRLINDGVMSVGLQTMENIKNRILQSISQQKPKDPGSDGPSRE